MQRGLSFGTNYNKNRIKYERMFLIYLPNSFYSISAVCFSSTSAIQYVQHLLVCHVPPLFLSLRFPLLFPYLNEGLSRFNWCPAGQLNMQKCQLLSIQWTMTVANFPILGTK